MPCAPSVRDARKPLDKLHQFRSCVLKNPLFVKIPRNEGWIPSPRLRFLWIFYYHRCRISVAQCTCILNYPLYTSISAWTEVRIAPCKGIRIPKSVKFVLVECGIQQICALESGILGFGVWNTAQGIRNPTND